MDTPLDWTKCQIFLAVAETGSLSAAAARLGLTQPTVGRQVRALEAAVNARLFDRHARGLHLTETAKALLPAARQMQDAAAALALTLAGKDEAPRGTVRLTASVFVSTFVLPEILAQLRRAHPEIEIELTASDQVENLLFREADIAVRMVRPEQLDMITQHLGEIRLGLYASRAYLAQRGLPNQPDDLLDHDLVGYDRSDLILRGFRASGLPAEVHHFTTRCDNQAAYWQLVRAGCGIGISQTVEADRCPDLVQVLPDLPLPSLPVWLTTHPSLRHAPRVAAVWQALRKGLMTRCTPTPA